MKICKKALAFLIIPFSLMLCLSSCIDDDTAKATIEDFLDAAESGDYTLAATYLHPERPSELKKFFEGIEASENIDLSDGIEIIRYSGVKSSHYDTSADGSLYATTLQVKIGDRSAEIEIEIADNEKGYGIYNFDIDIDD